MYTDVEESKIYQPLSEEQLLSGADNLLNHSDQYVRQLGSAVKESIQNDFENPNKLFGVMNLVLLVGEADEAVIIYMLQVVLYLKSITEYYTYKNIVSKHYNFIYNRAKRREIIAKYMDALKYILNNDNIDVILIESAFPGVYLPVTEAPKPEDDAEDFMEDVEEPEEDDEAEEDNADTLPKEDTGEEEPEAADFTEDVDGGEEGDDEEPDETDDTDNEDTPPEDEEGDDTDSDMDTAETDEDTGEDDIDAADFTEDVDDGEETPGDTPDDTGEEETTGEEDTNTEETPEEDTGEEETETEDEPADFTADADEEVPTDDEDTTDEDADTADDTMTDEDTENGDDNNKLQNSNVKNHNLLVDLRKNYESIDDLIQHLRTVTYPTSLQNSVLDRCIINLTKVKEDIANYIIYGFSTDYKANLYQYYTFIQALKLCLEMVKGITNLNDDAEH